MCGITGAVWTTPQRAVSREELRQMTGMLSHRGPDAEGEYHWQQAGQGVALGHRRLSIIDLAQGQQPMTNEDETLWVVFNGEIYNHHELRPDLKARGHRFRTECDTEVLLHLYEEYGCDMVQQLRGMFAFAIWDQTRKELFLARDRLGKKPLVYRSEQDRFLFASEFKALLQLPGVPRQVQPQAIDLYLAYQYVPQPHCILQGFQKLLPGHWALWKPGQLEIQQYWQAPFDEFSKPDSASRSPSLFSESVKQLRETLTEAVRLRLRSDVPLGAFLSGGIDSTIITGLMQQQMERPVETFSIGFEQPEYDERSFARMAAEKIGTRHHEYTIAPSAVESLPRLVWHYEEPFADSSAIPTMALCELTRQSVKVALTGDGGDELFAGYDRYQAVRLGAMLDQLPWTVKKFLTASFWQRLPASVSQKNVLRRFKRFQASLQQEPRLRYLEWISQFKQAERLVLYTPEFLEQIQPQAAADWFFHVYEQVQNRDIVTRTAAADQISYLPCDILTKVDIASMAYGLECRSPLLDHRVAELAARLPISFKIKDRTGKYILREAFRDLIPELILHRKKMGFGVPVDHWFRGELKPLLHDYLLDDRTIARGYFRPTAVQQLIEEHQQKKRDHSYRLWSLLVLEVWHRLYIDGNGLRPL